MMRVASLSPEKQHDKIRYLYFSENKHEAQNCAFLVEEGYYVEDA
jgi:hypothetical protein